jgi:hypothetical protein
MEIRAGDVTIRNGGNINGDTGNISGAITNGGAIYLKILQTGATTGSLIIEPGGRLSSDRLTGTGNGRGGNVTALAEGQIWVQADPSGTPRGVISSNTQASSVNAFINNCHLSEVTLVATGTGVAAIPGVAGIPAIRIDGTVQIASPPPAREPFIGGIITMLGGGDVSNLASDPPFPSALLNGFLVGLPFPPTLSPQNSATIYVSGTGIVEVSAKDQGGGEIIMYACFIVIEGLVDVGRDPGMPSGGSREARLPTFISMKAHETIEVRPDTMGRNGRVQANVRQGFKTHVGQPTLPGTVVGTLPCDFNPYGRPPDQNREAPGTERGGGDICMDARALISIDGTGLGAGDFAVSATSRVSSTIGGAVLLIAYDATFTQEGSIELVGNAVNVSSLGNGGGGGMVTALAFQDIDVQGVVQANGLGQGGMIDLEAVNGAVTQPAGQLVATGAVPGLISIRECTVNAADNPTSNPAAMLLAADCGNTHLVTAAAIPPERPCGAACFCLQSFRVRAGVLTITGLGLKGVKLVEFNATCATDPGMGNEVALPPSPMDTNFTQSDTTITLTLPAGTAGTHIILSSPAGPSSSCSLGTL